MNIAFLLHTYPGIGGTETVSNMLMQWLETSHLRSKIHTSIIAWKIGSYRAISGDGWGRIKYLPDANRIDSDENLHAILRYVDEYSINIIINQGPFWKGHPQLQSHGCKLISVLHYAPSFRIDNNRNVIDRLFHAHSNSIVYKLKTTVRYCFKDYFAKRDFNRDEAGFFRDVINNSDAFVVLCPPYIAELKSLLNINAQNMVAIPNPCSLYSSGNVACHHGKKLLFMGRLTAWDKRVDRLLKIWKHIFKAHPDWSLYIVGDGEERARLEAMAVNMKLPRVVFTGFCDPIEYYKESSILCMTSSSEGFSMVIGEAAMYKMPAIAYNVSAGISTLIKDGETGYLINPFNEKQYIAKLTSLMNEPATLTKMGVQAYKYFSATYAIDKVGVQWLNLFQSILK